MRFFRKTGLEPAAYRQQTMSEIDFDIKIYCVQDKRYLTDDDMNRKDLHSLIVVAIKKNEETISTRIDITQPDEWPTEIGKYEIHININGGMRDDSVLELNENFKRKSSILVSMILLVDIENSAC